MLHFIIPDPMFPPEISYCYRSLTITYFPLSIEITWMFSWSYMFMVESEGKAAGWMRIGLTVLLPPLVRKHQVGWPIVVYVMAMSFLREGMVDAGWNGYVSQKKFQPFCFSAVVGCQFPNIFFKVAQNVDMCFYFQLEIQNKSYSHTKAELAWVIHATHPNQTPPHL